MQIKLQRELQVPSLDGASPGKYNPLDDLSASCGLLKRRADTCLKMVPGSEGVPLRHTPRELPDLHAHRLHPDAGQGPFLRGQSFHVPPRGHRRLPLCGRPGHHAEFRPPERRHSHLRIFQAGHADPSSHEFSLLRRHPYLASGGRASLRRGRDHRAQSAPEGGACVLRGRGKHTRRDGGARKRGARITNDPVAPPRHASGLRPQ